MSQTDRRWCFFAWFIWAHPTKELGDNDTRKWPERSQRVTEPVRNESSGCRLAGV
jgi:hypothetical protein